MAERKDHAIKRLKEQNKHLIVENTNTSLLAAKSILADPQNPQRVGTIQSMLRVGLPAQKPQFPAINLKIDHKLPPLVKAEMIIDKCLDGQISGDHCQVLTQALLSTEQLRHDLKFSQKYQELIAYVGEDKVQLIERIAELESKLALRAVS